MDLPPSEVSRWRAISRVLRSPLDVFACLVYPAPCALCGHPLPRLSLAPVCDFCWSKISFHDGPVCFRCGETLLVSKSQVLPQQLCRACRLVASPFQRAVSYGRYDDQLKLAIHALKYDALRPLAAKLGGKLAQAIALLADDAPQNLLVVPIPLHPSKYRQRGFNQAYTLADHALRRLRSTHPQWRLQLDGKILRRVRATESQAGLSNTMRRRNVRGAFAVARPEQVKGRDVLLIDDIYTTGATARAAATALRQAGAHAVWVVTLAHTNYAFSSRVSEARRNSSSSSAGAEAQAATLPLASPFQVHGSSSF